MSEEPLDMPAIRKARGKFVCMAATYALMVFNDNFFKQAAMLLAVAGGMLAYQGYILAIFTLPFVLFAAPAGWLADRFAKRSVVIGAKWTELIAMLIGAAGICTGNWVLIFTMMCIMGIQSTFFSPSLNGSIPELYPAGYVIRANAILRVFVTAAILAGTALAGKALERKGAGWGGFPPGELTVAYVVVAIAVLGVIASYGIPRRPAADPGVRFPWSGPVNTVRRLADIVRDPLLALTIGAAVFIWFVGSLQILLINPLGLQQYGFDKATTSLLLLSQLGGIAVGGLLAGWLAHGQRWYRVLGPAGLIFSALMIGMAGLPSLPVPVQRPLLFLCLGLIGTAGGVFMIPVEGFIQIRPAPDQKGVVWASANFVVFIGIMLSGPLSNVFSVTCRLKPTTSFGIAGVFSLGMTLWFWHQFGRKGT